MTVFRERNNVIGMHVEKTFVGKKKQAIGCSLSGWCRRWRRINEIRGDRTDEITNPQQQESPYRYQMPPSKKASVEVSNVSWVRSVKWWCAPRQNAHRQDCPTSKPPPDKLQCRLVNFKCSHTSLFRWAMVCEANWRKDGGTLAKTAKHSVLLIQGCYCECSYYFVTECSEKQN